MQIAPAMKFSADGPDTYLNNTELWAINVKQVSQRSAHGGFLPDADGGSGAKCANIDEEGLMARFGTGYLPSLEVLAKGEGVAASGTVRRRKDGGGAGAGYSGQGRSDPAALCGCSDSEINTIIAEVVGEMFLKRTLRRKPRRPRCVPGSGRSEAFFERAADRGLPAALLFFTEKRGSTLET